MFYTIVLNACLNMSSIFFAFFVKFYKNAKLRGFCGSPMENLRDFRRNDSSARYEMPCAKGMLNTIYEASYAKY